MSSTDGITEGLSGKERMELRAEVAGRLRYAHRRSGIPAAHTPCRKGFGCLRGTGH